MEEKTAALLDFIADEDTALAAGKQGEFWPRNHHWFDPYLTQAESCLDAFTLQRLYFHMLRLGQLLAVSDKALPALISAYREVLPHIEEDGFRNCRLEYLFCFGFDEHGELPSGATRTAATLKNHVRTLDKIKRFTTLENQRNKAETFLPFVAEAPRILESFRHLGYRNGRQLVREERFASFTWSDMLLFWGLALIVLLADDTRMALMHDMTSSGYRLPDRENQLSILYDTSLAVLPLCPEDAAFAAMVAPLESVAEVALANSWDKTVESWLRQKGLWPQDNEHPDWTFAIQMSTCDVRDWSVRASKVPAEALWLSLNVHRQLGWKAQLYPRNNVFRVDWSEDRLCVDSQQLRYRHVMKWPGLAEPDRFPALTAELERLLSVKFNRHLHLQITSLDARGVETLRQWLAPIADQISMCVGKVRGKLPGGVKKDKYTIEFSTATPLL
jgi:hypothetical protein